MKCLIVHRLLVHPAGAVIAIKDMNEHYYLAVEEKDTKTGTFRLTGVLHYSLVGDKALFKVLNLVTG